MLAPSPAGGHFPFWALLEFVEVAVEVMKFFLFFSTAHPDADCFFVI